MDDECRFHLERLEQKLEEAKRSYGVADSRANQLQRDLDIERRANARLRDQRRDMLAGFAMTGLLANGREMSFAEFQVEAVKHADALIAELDKKGGADGV